MREQIKINIPETHSLDSLEGIIPVEEEMMSETHVLDLEGSKKETPAQKDARVAGVRDKISGKMLENPLDRSAIQEFMRISLSNLSGFFQMFDADRPDLSGHIVTATRHLQRLDESIAQLGAAHMNELRDKLLELRGRVTLFIEAAEENKIVFKSVFLREIKNRAEVAFLSQKLFRDLGVLREEIQKEGK